MAYPAITLSEPILTPEAYLLLENDNPEGIRHEYVNGLVYAVAGASRNHNRVARRLTARLELHLQGTPCEPFQSDMKVKVLSDATKRHDRTEKRLAYQRLASLRENVLLSQDSPYLELYRRRTEWQRECYAGAQTVTLESVDMALVVEELYQ